MPSARNHFIDIAILAGLLAVGIVGYRYSPLLLPKSDVVATVEPGCNLHRGPCFASLPGGGRIELSIEPRPIPTVQPLTVRIGVGGIEARSAAIDFAGIGMNMGYNRPTLDAVAGGFAGGASLPVCITGSMSWEATVLLETDRLRIAAPFRFDSTPH